VHESMPVLFFISLKWQKHGLPMTLNIFNYIKAAFELALFASFYLN